MNEEKNNSKSKKEKSKTLKKQEKTAQYKWVKHLYACMDEFKEDVRQIKARLTKIEIFLGLGKKKDEQRVRCVDCKNLKLIDATKYQCIESKDIIHQRNVQTIHQCEGYEHK